MVMSAEADLTHVCAGRCDLLEPKATVIKHPPCIIKVDFIQSFKLVQPCLVGYITFARREADSAADREM